MWLIIFGLTFLFAICGIIYLFTRFQRFYIVRRIAGEKKAIQWLLALIPIAIFGCWFYFDRMDAIVAVLSLMFVWLIGDLIGWIIRKTGKRADDENQPGPYYTGIIVIVFTFIYLCTGWYLAHHVFRTVYDLKTDKQILKDPLKVVFFADSHIGTTFDGEGFAKHMETIRAEEPDIVIIAGDYVDDDSVKEDMIRSCRALGDIPASFGVYYVFGNHDKGYSNHRDFTYEDLKDELHKNGVTVLEDEAVLLNDSFYVIGRKDASEKDRKNAAEMVKGLESDKYMIMIDHQPNDYEAEEKSGVDLVLSGHTHGGQMLPVTKVGEWFGINDSTYGYEKRNSTDFIVTSGISDWAMRFKTGTKSEYVVINIFQ